MRVIRKDLWGNSILEEFDDGKSNPRRWKHCKHHGWDYFTSYFSESKNRRSYECPGCHSVRGLNYTKRKRETDGIISDKIRQMMYKEHRDQNLPCSDCGKLEDEIKLYTYGRSHPWQIDHINPDGGAGFENLQVLCQYCNGKKNNKIKKQGDEYEGGTLEKFFEVLKEV